MKLWQTIALVLAGVVYGLIEPGRLTYAFGHATLYVLLPALLFEAAWNLQFRAIVRQWRAIVTLAVPGVLLTALIVAGALAIVRVPFGVGLLAGAILSATDPIAVVAVFRRIRVPVSLRTIVECESLFNDAVAVVLYRAILAVLLAGALDGARVGAVAGGALLASCAGIGIGIALAFLAALALRDRSSATIQSIATVVVAYLAYYGAERVGASGIFATIACGIALRRFERRWITLRVAHEVHRFWDVAAIGANVVVFFLVGAALELSIVARDPAFVIAALAGVAVARFAVAGLLLPGGFPPGWLEVVRVAGMRGALSLALALALPAAVPQRDAIVAATFAVALATIVASGLAVPAVLRRARA